MNPERSDDEPIIDLTIDEPIIDLTIGNSTTVEMSALSADAMDLWDLEDDVIILDYEEELIAGMEPIEYWSSNESDISTVEMSALSADAMDLWDLEDDVIILDYEEELIAGMEPIEYCSSNNEGDYEDDISTVEMGAASADDMDLSDLEDDVIILDYEEELIVGMEPSDYSSSSNEGDYEDDISVEMSALLADDMYLSDLEDDVIILDYSSSNEGDSEDDISTVEMGATSADDMYLSDLEFDVILADEEELIVEMQPIDIGCPLVKRLTKPRLSYNEDVLTDAKGECVICLEELNPGDVIARLPCLCVYHKGCIEKWFEVNRSCPEHPGD